MADDAQLERLASEAGAVLQQAGLVAVTAESCTGGWIAKSFTDVAGSSGWFDRAFITYSNGAKVQMLGVQPEVIEREGAVSEATVEAMAKGALAQSGASVSVAVSGIAGPDGGTPARPVGTVWLAWARRRGSAVEVNSRCLRLEGTREAIRRQSVAIALQGVIALAKR